MKTVLVIFIIFVAMCLISWIADTHRFVTRFYEMKDVRVSKPVRFVFISDLHNKEYGTDNEKLLEKIKTLRPDGVLIGGDLCNGIKEADFSPAVKILSDLKSHYPIYYAMGNHEYRLKIYPDKYGDMWKKYNEELCKLGIHILDNERISLKDYNIDIAAISIESEFYKRFRGGKRLRREDAVSYLGEADPKKFELLLAHNPEYFDAYSRWGADLTLSGHVHGGIMRLPFIGGVISPRLLPFPRYSNGLYHRNGKTMIVSCGLGTHTLHVRVFNPGELSVIDIKP